MRARSWAVRAAAALIFTASLAGGARAESIRQVLKTDFRILPDLTVVETIHQEVTPLAESAVRSAAQTSWAVNGNQTFEVVEAFTRKADGRKIPADSSDFVTQDGAVGSAMSYVDIKIQQIPFRDLSVGDTAVLMLRITEKEHYIPNNYSYATVMVPGPVRKSIDVTLRTPAALDIRHDEQSLAYDEQRQGDDIVRHWSGTSTEATVDEKNIADLPFSVPALRFSTFSGFESIATAYYERAKPKAAVTPEIQQLADQITKDKPEVRDQAQAIYEWVTRNIRYVAVYFGSGRFVPNDAVTILSRRFGDCKDDATLMSALLAAKGIASEEVLLGTSPIYRLSTTPTVSAFNHVIVYIPALDLYVDPTVAFGNFNHLPASDSGRPVVRVSDKGPVVARTPASSERDNVIELDSRMTASRNGERSGQTTITARGDFADTIRAFMAQAEARGKDVALQTLAQQRGLLGGTYDVEGPPWTDPHEPYRITTKWSLPKAPGAASQRVPTGFSPILPHPAFFFGAFGATKRAYPAVCRAGRIVHTVHVTLPDTVVSVKLPPPVKKSTPQFSYRDEWTQDGRELRRRTEVASSAASGACSPDQIEAVSAAIRSIGTTSGPMVASARPGAAPTGHPSLMQQLFGGQPAANQTAAPPHGAAAPAARSTSPTSR